MVGLARHRLPKLLRRVMAPLLAPLPAVVGGWAWPKQRLQAGDPPCQVLVMACLQKVLHAQRWAVMLHCVGVQEGQPTCRQITAPWVHRPSTPRT
jgi:hypothetical protein